MNMDTFLYVLGAFVGVANAITATAALRTLVVANKTNKNVALVEVATNSMKDALVAATKKAAYAEGADHARAAGEVKAAALAEGQLRTA